MIAVVGTAGHYKDFISHIVNRDDYQLINSVEALNSIDFASRSRITEVIMLNSMYQIREEARSEILAAIANQEDAEHGGWSQSLIEERAGQLAQLLRKHEEEQ